MKNENAIMDRIKARIAYHANEHRHTYEIGKGVMDFLARDLLADFKAAAMKKQAENVIGYMIKTQLRGVRFTRPVVIHYTWIEPNRRRDKDNIAFAKKFIQDSLVHAGVLQNDGWKHIEHFTDDFAVDPKNPRVEVIIEEFEGGYKK